MERSIMDDVTAVLRAFERDRKDIGAISETILTRALRRTGATHGFVACRRSPTDDRVRVISLHDAPPRAFTGLEVGGEVDLGEFVRHVSRDYVVSTLHGGSDRVAGVVVLHNTTKVPNETLLKSLQPLLPLAASVVVSGYQMSTQLCESHETFLATMSHEMRTPLNGVVGMTRLLRELPRLDDEERRWADIAYTCGMQVVEIVSDLLDYSRMDAGKITIAREPFDLEDLLRSAHEIVEPRALEKNLSVTYEIHPTCPSVLVGDAKRVRQVLINLLNNAVKFTSQGSVTTTVRSRPDDTSGSSGSGSSNSHLVHFSVRDTGSGIAPENFERVFESYVHIDTGAAHAEGTGLGLSICKKLVTLMGGRIGIESSHKNSGTVMGFSVPMGIGSSANIEALEALVANKSALVVVADASERCAIYNTLLKLRMRPFGCGTVQEAQVYLSGDFAFDAALVGRGLEGEWQESMRRRGVPVVDVAEVEQHDDKLLEKLVVSMRSRGSNSGHHGHRTQRSSAWGSRRVYDDLLILVVEDTPHNLEVVLTTLQYQLGYDRKTIHTARNGMDAVNQCRKQRFDVVLMDLRMPGVDGFAATRMILEECRKYEREPPVVVPMTAYVTDEDRARCTSVGMSGFLSKPLNDRALESVLSAIRSQKDRH